MIELLNEQKQAIIHQAVTRGLDPDVPMKPTGLDWLPEVPEHWEIFRSKRSLQISRSEHQTATEVVCNATCTGLVRTLASRFSLS